MRQAARPSTKQDVNHQDSIPVKYHLNKKLHKLYKKSVKTKLVVLLMWINEFNLNGIPAIQLRD